MGNGVVSASPFLFLQSSNDSDSDHLLFGHPFINQNLVTFVVNFGWFLGAIPAGWCMVVRCDVICYAGRSIPFWRSGWSKELQENHPSKPFFCLWSFDSLNLCFWYVVEFAPNECFGDLYQRIMSVQYKIPDYVHISQDCRHLLSRLFVANPSRVYPFKLWY